jgi:hypothetical protein
VRGFFVYSRGAHRSGCVPRCSADSLEAPVQFELVGSLLGLAIYNSVILDVNFPLALYRKLKRESMTLRDLEELKPDVARSMRLLLDYDKPDLEDVFCLNFTVTYDAWGERKTHDLIHDGSSVPVTPANRKVRGHHRGVLVAIYSKLRYFTSPLADALILVALRRCVPPVVPH